jgi:hypothetical protein
MGSLHGITMSAILPPVIKETYQKKKKVQSKVKTKQGAAQLVAGIPWPPTPYGGASGPTNYWSIPVTSSTFGSQATRPWLFQFDRMVRTGIRVNISWGTASSTIGELRLYCNGAVTDTITLPAASSGFQEFKWLHGQPLWGTTPVVLYVECRRTSGSSNVNIGIPQGRLCAPDGCTETGV